MTDATRWPPEHDSALANAVADFCRRTDAGSPREPHDTASHPVWQAVRAAGSEPWLDSANLEANREVWSAEFDGLTTNNSLLNEEAKKGHFDAMIGAVADVLHATGHELSERELVLEIAFALNAMHGLELARTFGADVSVELHTDLAHDDAATREYGRRLHAICPEHFVVKVPLTPEGLLAARRLETDGVRVNCTLGFSPRQNELVARFAQPHFVNVFLGRVDSFCAAGDLVAPEGDVGPGVAATLASQRMLRAIRPEVATQQIAASMREASQVGQLAGVDVMTMPVEVARDFASGADPEAIADRTREEEGGAPQPAESASASGADVFYRSQPAARVAAEQLLHRPLDIVDGDRVRAILADCGIGDLFPKLSAADRERIAADGKLPDRAHWQDRVTAGELAWDALLSAAGLARFAHDQAELDARIRTQLS